MCNLTSFSAWGNSTSEPVSAAATVAQPAELQTASTTASNVSTDIVKVEEVKMVAAVAKPSASGSMSAQMQIKDDSLFDKKYTTINKTTDYMPEWSVDNELVLETVSVKPGEQMKAIDPQGRKIILTGTSAGVVAVYQRHAGISSVLHSYVPSKLKQLTNMDFADTSEQDVEFLIGGTSDKVPNIGQRVEAFFSMGSTGI